MRDETPASEPEAANVNGLRAAFEELESLSNELLNALAQEDVHRVAQLLFQRGERIRRIEAYDLSGQPPQAQAFMKTKMDAVEFLEPSIQLKIGALTRSFADKMNQAREQRWLVRRYRGDISGHEPAAGDEA